MNNRNSFLTYLICIYIVVMPLIPYNAIALKGIHISGDLILAAIILMYLLKLVFFSESRKRFVIGIKDFFSDYLSLSLLLMALVMIISIAYAFDKKIAISESARFITYLILFFVIKYESSDRRSIDMFTASYFTACAVVCIFGIIQYFTGIGLSDVFKNYAYTRVKIASTLENPNNLAAFTILAIFPLIMTTIYEKNKKRKTIFAILLVLVFVNMILTFSRNIIIGFGVGMCVLILIYSWRFIIAVFALGGLSMFIPEVKSRVVAISDPVQNQSRIYLWKIAGKMIKDHPIRGVGNGNYTSLYPEYVKRYPEYAFYMYTKSEPCHNSYIKIQTELGVFGSAAFAAIIVSSILKVKEFINSSRDGFYKYFYVGFFASMIAFFVMNLADNLFFVPKTTTYFWLLLSICQAKLYKLSENE
jgi:putative inorganic carbon (hco3(-)) transporter